MDVLESARQGSILLLNSPYGADAVWDHLPRSAQQQIIDKQIQLYVIDASSVARETGMGGRTNTIMQTCFFAISGVLAREEAISKIKESIRKTYGKKGDEVVQKNFAAVDLTLAHLYQVDIPGSRQPHRNAAGGIARGAGVRTESDGYDDGGQG